MNVKEAPKEIPTSLREAIIFYADEENCIADMLAIRGKSGLCCPRCGDLEVARIKPKVQKAHVLWYCNGCKRQFSLKIGTIFEDSALPLSKWLPAVWLITGAKNGISSCELSRALGVTQKTAWFMLQRIRNALSLGQLDMFQGAVEADETYVGGIEDNKHKDKKLNLGRGGVGKAVVMGILNRGDLTKKSKIRAHVIPNTKRKTLHGKIKEHVEEASAVYTDAHLSYRGLAPKYLHEFVDHATNYALGQVHTNGVENFWSLLKRCLKGTYVCVQPFHLKRYIDEMVFRFNHREGTDRDRFVSAMGMIHGKRLSYDSLTRAYEAFLDQILPREGNGQIALATGR